jgi:hypothetical protein
MYFARLSATNSHRFPEAVKIGVKIKARESLFIHF